MFIPHESATDLVALIHSGDLTAVEVTTALLERIERHDASLQAMLRVDNQAALAQAEAIDARRRRGEPLGSLAGVPVAVKDNMCTRGEATTCASRMLEPFVPPYDATVIGRLREAGAVVIGKTNLDEFAMGSTTENSAFGVTRNPWDPERVPGGSSGGSAASVAAGFAPLALGSDTGGSIRAPAALCGVTGMKPTYGRVSRYGLVAFASSLDQIGPFGRSAADVAVLLETIAGHDPADTTSVDVPVPRYSESVSRPLENLRIGWVKEHFGAGIGDDVAAAVREAIRTYESLGASVREVSLPHAKYSIAVYYVIAPCEASSNLARFDGVHYGMRTDEAVMRAELDDERARLEKAGDERGLADMDTAMVRLYRKTRAEGFGPEVKRRIMLGTYALSSGYYDAYYKRALQVRRLIREDYDRAFAEVDMIVGPVTPTTAFRLGERVDDPLSMYLFDLYTCGANLAGLPGISLPCGFDGQGLPIGLQLQAAPFEEEKLLRAAHMYQTATDWHTRRPELA
ncbi:MAG: Asp-tRNA(Asn)/Glu-tRNA(Gln) amidotransferase subunit GatA [Planctomycetales bacterium]|nr:Asp-tRNA(Asn)/Glu-tRNA(Gln) amidotransferase subunit GatA [Planctomycetales bacterium]